jgi:hypothetical protein
MIREMILIYKIWKWHDKNFDITCHEQKEKLKSEIDEFNEAFKKFIKSPYPRRPKYKVNVDNEMIDVIIAGINCLKYPEIFERVAVKHSINTHRTWKGVQHQ